MLTIIYGDVENSIYFKSDRRNQEGEIRLLDKKKHYVFHRRQWFWKDGGTS